MRRLTAFVTLAVIAIAAVGCAPSPSPAEMAEALRSRVSGFKGARVTVHGRQLLHPTAVGSFYKNRAFKPVWTRRASVEEVVQAIEGISRDGLTPADYHLDTLRALLEDGERTEDPKLAADLDLLVTDAVAGMVDHMRYGRVRPVQLDPRWNVNPREGATGMDTVLAQIVRVPSIAKAIEDQRPDHFIYRGLVDALARLESIASEGGWPRVPTGKNIAPGSRDPRIPAFRARLAATGEYPVRAGEDSTMFDESLVAAVKLFQERHRLKADGIVDGPTVAAMNVSARERADQVRANLERARWVVDRLEDDFLLVNLPAFKAYLIRDGKNEWETRTQIGEEARQTPTFRSNINSIEFNPDWTVPPTILAKDVLEGMRKGENVIAQKRLLILDGEGNEVSPGSIDWGSATPENFPYTLRQPPGEGSALGDVKFDFPNKYSIYLHDTPSQSLFESDDRTFSSGCIRVENALDLADRLLQGQDGWSASRIREFAATHDSKTVKVEKSLPILIVYWTVSVGASGEIRYMNDVYERDGPVLAAMAAEPRGV